jgi:hypothetical protein
MHACKCARERVQIGFGIQSCGSARREYQYVTRLALPYGCQVPGLPRTHYPVNVRKGIGRSWRADRLRSSTKHKLCLGITKASGDMTMVV